MSDFDDLISPKIKVDFRGKEYEVEPFTVEDTPVIRMFSDRDPEVSSKGAKLMILSILKKLFPTEKEDRLKKVDAKFIPEVIEVFNKLNESDEEEKEKIKEKLMKAAGE